MGDLENRARTGQPWSVGHIRDDQSSVEDKHIYIFFFQNTSEDNDEFWFDDIKNWDLMPPLTRLWPLTRTAWRKWTCSARTSVTWRSWGSSCCWPATRPSRPRSAGRCRRSISGGTTCFTTSEPGESRPQVPPAATAQRETAMFMSIKAFSRGGRLCCLRSTLQRQMTGWGSDCVLLKMNHNLHH